MSEFRRLIFPTQLLVGQVKSTEICSKIEELAYKFKNNTTDAPLVSGKWNYNERSGSQEDYNTYGVTSYNSEVLLENPEWREAIDFIYDFASTMIRSVYDGTDKPTLLSLWTTIYPPGGYIPEHTHSNSLMSGVFYVKAPENCGNIVFKDISCVAKTMCVNNVRSFPTVDTTWTEPVEAGKMIVFPSWLPHLTLPNKSNEDRIILSFNIGIAKGE